MQTNSAQNSPYQPFFTHAVGPLRKISHLEYVRDRILDTENTIRRTELDERLLSREILKPTLYSKAETERQLGVVQDRLKQGRHVLAFLKEMEAEYAKAEATEAAPE